MRVGLNLDPISNQFVHLQRGHCGGCGGCSGVGSGCSLGGGDGAGASQRDAEERERLLVEQNARLRRAAAEQGGA